MIALLRLAPLLFLPAVAEASTTVPGHTDRHDADDNGFPDAGVVVTGHYEALYAWDEDDWYLDYGDGRVAGTVDGVDELDPETATICDYVVNYRGTYDNDPFLDSGWIGNQIACSGPDAPAATHYLLVHETDPRFTGHPDWTEAGWETVVLTVSGQGNLVQPLEPATHRP